MRLLRRLFSIFTLAERIEENTRELQRMSANSDALNAAIADLTTAANNVATEVAALNSGDDQTAIAHATTQIQTITAQLNGLVPATEPETPAS